MTAEAYGADVTVVKETTPSSPSTPGREKSPYVAKNASTISSYVLHRPLELARAQKPPPTWAFPDITNS